MTDLDKTAQELVSKWEHGDETHRQWLRDKATPDILAALQSVRDETREATLREAIEACPPASPLGGLYRLGYWDGIKAQEDAIRALLTEPASEAPDPDGLPIPQFLRRKEAPDRGGRAVMPDKETKIEIGNTVRHVSDDGSMGTAPRDGTPILIRFEHMNFKYAREDQDGGAQWEALQEARWIDHNGGGWTWHGMAGTPTGWRPK